MVKARFSDLPTFKYHPNPFSSGALIESDGTCECCGLAQGYMYEGPVYCVAEVEMVCPWCIADGSAKIKWNAQFTDAVFQDSYGDHFELSADVVDQVLSRTPGPGGASHPVTWWVHCGEPAEFVRAAEDRVRFRCGVCGKRRAYRVVD